MRPFHDLTGHDWRYAMSECKNTGRWSYCFWIGTLITRFGIVTQSIQSQYDAAAELFDFRKGVSFTTSALDYGWLTWHCVRLIGVESPCSHFLVFRQLSYECLKGNIAISNTGARANV